VEIRPNQPDSSSHSEKVVRLDTPAAPPAVEAAAAPSDRRAHLLAVVAMTASALVAIIALLAFITIRWPGESGELLKKVFVLAGVGFMTSASMAVFFAMRRPRGPFDSRD
jgi:hypothetical protein